MPRRKSAKTRPYRGSRAVGWAESARVGGGISPNPRPSARAATVASPGRPAIMSGDEGVGAGFAWPGRPGGRPMLGARVGMIVQVGAVAGLLIASTATLWTAGSAAVERDRRRAA